jgi:hypothetical protein
MSLSIVIDIFIALVCRYQPHIYDRMSLSIVIDIFIALVCRYQPHIYDRMLLSIVIDIFIAFAINMSITIDNDIRSYM